MKRNEQMLGLTEQLKKTSEKHKEIGMQSCPHFALVRTRCSALQAEKVMSERAKITFHSQDCQTDPIGLLSSEE